MARNILNMNASPLMGVVNGFGRVSIFGGDEPQTIAIPVGVMGHRHMAGPVCYIEHACPHIGDMDPEKIQTQFDYP